VSALGGVHHLDLRNCPGISDVSALAGVHHLDLRNCQGIGDVSALEGVCIPCVWAVVKAFVM
jgi:ribosomal protein S12 methylthiotransferase accessory factor YcaO